jgi:hypothetical protein
MKDRYARQININRQSTNVPSGSVGLPVGTYGATETGNNTGVGLIGAVDDFGRDDFLQPLFLL